MTQPVPSRTYQVQVPDFVLHYDDRSNADELREVEEQSRRLNMQCYGLAMIDMFHEIDGLDSVRIDGESDCYLRVIEAEFEDGTDGQRDEDIEMCMEIVNDLRDETIYGFIEDIVGNETLTRDNVEECIASAYDRIAEEKSAPTWGEIKAKREVFLQAQQLDANTHGASSKGPGRRV